MSSQKMEEKEGEKRNRRRRVSEAAKPWCWSLGIPWGNVLLERDGWMGAAHKLIFWCMAEEAEGKMPDHGNRSKCQKHRKERKVPQKRKGPVRHWLPQGSSQQMQHFLPRRLCAGFGNGRSAEEPAQSALCRGSGRPSPAAVGGRGQEGETPRAVRQGGITEVSLGCGGLSWGLVKWNGGFKFQAKQQFPAGAQTAYNYACSCEWGCTVPPKCPHLWGLLCLPTHGHVDLRRATCRCDRCQPLREEMLHFPTIPELRSPKHNSISTLVQFHPYFSDLISVKLKYNRGLRALLDNFKSNLTKISNPATDHWEFVQESYTQLVVLWFCSCSDTIIFNPNKFSKTFQQ